MKCKQKNKVIRVLIYFTGRRQGTAFRYYRMIRLRYTFGRSVF